MLTQQLPTLRTTVNLNREEGDPKMRKMSKAFYIVLLLTSTFAHAATELARINDHVITLEEFNKKYQESLKFFQLRAPSKKAVLDELIKREIAVQEAKKNGLDKESIVTDRIETVLYNALLEKKLTTEFEKIHVSDEEAKEFYTKNPEIRTSQLFVALKPDATTKDEKDAMDRMKKMETEVQAGKGFSDVAQRLSDGPTAPMGGDMDYQTRDRLDPIYYSEAIKLKTIGKMSPVFRTPFGYHIVKLTGTKTWEQVDHALVKRLVFAQRRVEIFENYMKDLRKKNQVTANEDLLKD